MNVSDSIVTLPAPAAPRSFLSGFDVIDDAAREHGSDGLLRSGELTVVYGTAKSGRTQTLVRAAANIVAALTDDEVVLITLGATSPEVFLNRLAEEMLPGRDERTVENLIRGRVRIARVNDIGNIVEFVSQLTVTDKEVATAAAAFPNRRMRTARVAALLVDDFGAFANASEIAMLTAIAHGSLAGARRLGGISGDASEITPRQIVDPMAVMVTFRATGNASGMQMPIMVMQNAHHVITVTGAVRKSRTLMPPPPIELPEFYLDSAGDGSDETLWRRHGDAIEPVLRKADLPEEGQALWARLTAGFIGG